MATIIERRDETSEDSRNVNQLPEEYKITVRDVREAIANGTASPEILAMDEEMTQVLRKLVLVIKS